MTIDPEIWKARLAHHVAPMNEGYPFGEWTWTTGGCFAFAEAFHAAFGGEFYGVCRVTDDEDLPVDHALVKLGSVYYDHDGPFDVSKIAADQVVRHRDDDYVCWFEDDFFDDEGWAEIHAVLADCAALLGLAVDQGLGDAELPSPR